MEIKGKIRCPKCLNYIYVGYFSGRAMLKASGGVGAITFVNPEGGKCPFCNENIDSSEIRRILAS